MNHDQRQYAMERKHSDGDEPPLLIQHFSGLYLLVNGASISIKGIPHKVYKEAFPEKRVLRLEKS
jgi:hypothetical protein